MKRSVNFIALRECRDSVRISSLAEIDSDPSLFVFSRMMELFAELNLPVEMVGRLRIVIAPSFFEDKKLANEIIYYFVKDCERIYSLIKDRVPDEDKAVQIFGDYIERNMGLQWLNWNYGQDPDSDEENEEIF